MRGKTVDELTSEALKRDLARRATQRIRREAEERREGTSDSQIEGIVNQAAREPTERAAAGHARRVIAGSTDTTRRLTR